MDADRFESLVTQVLEETRAFRTEFREEMNEFREEMTEFREEMTEFREQTNERFASVDRRFVSVERDIRLLQTAVTETADAVKRVETKLDKTIAEHGARLDKLEGAAQ